MTLSETSIIKEEKYTNHVISHKQLNKYINTLNKVT